MQFAVPGDAYSTALPILNNCLLFTIQIHRVLQETKSSYLLFEIFHFLFPAKVDNFFRKIAIKHKSKFAFLAYMHNNPSFFIWLYDVGCFFWHKTNPKTQDKNSFLQSNSSLSYFCLFDSFLIFFVKTGKDIAETAQLLHNWNLDCFIGW